MSVVRTANFRTAQIAAGDSAYIDVSYKAEPSNTTLKFTAYPEDAFSVDPPSVQVNPVEASTSTQLRINKKSVNSDVCIVKCAMKETATGDKDSYAYASILVSGSSQPNVFHVRPDHDLTFSFRGHPLGEKIGLRDLKIDELLMLASGPPLKHAKAPRAAKKAGGKKPAKSTAKKPAKSTAKKPVKKAPAKAKAPAKPAKAAGSKGKPAAKKAGGKRGAKT